MTEEQREASVSTIYKGKGKDKAEKNSYRPIAVTPTDYRILTKAIQKKLLPAVLQVIGKTQVGYVGGSRQAHDNTLLLAEMARKLDAPGEGGVAVQVDNTSAFDLVRWDFTHELLEAYGFPESFRNLMRAIYTDLTIRIKVNGIEGEPMEVSNGVRQGCGVSPLIFILVQEALLSGIREDPVLQGLTVSHHRENREVSVSELRERCLADDTLVFLKNINQVPKLFQIIKEFELVSGQELNSVKSSTILCNYQWAGRLALIVVLLP